MKNIFFFLAFISQAHHGFSQNVDSLSEARTVDSLLMAADDQRKSGKNEDALLLAQQAAEISKKTWGEHNERYAASMYCQGIACASLLQYDKAEQLLLKVIDLQALLLGREHPEYVKSLNRLGVIYLNKGDFSKAERQFLEVIQLRAKILGKEHLDYASSIEELAVTYMTESDYVKAEPLLWEVKGIVAKKGGKTQPAYARSLINLAVLFYYKGDYAKAETLFIEAGKIRANTLGTEHPDYAEYLEKLGILYEDKCEYDKAEPLLLKAIEIQAKTSGKEHPDYATSLEELAILYEDMGDYSRAESLYLEAQEIQAKAVGKEHANYAAFLVNLACMYSVKGDYSKAEPLFLQAIEIQKKSLGTEHPEYASSLENLAILYTNRDEYSKAESLTVQAIKIKAAVLGKEHPDYATSLTYLANIYCHNGDFVKAEQLLLEAKEIQAKVLGREHRAYIESMDLLATIYEKTNRLPQATAAFLETSELNNHLIEKAADYSSESQMLAYLQTFDKKTTQFQSFVQTHPNPELIRTIFDNALFFNGFLLENARRLARSVTGTDSLTRDAFERWQGCKRRLAKEYAKPIAERERVAEVEDEAEIYEKILTRKLSVFDFTHNVPHWQMIRDNLHPGEAAVEFIHYRYYSPSPTDSILYAALILRPGDAQPQLIPLFEEKELSRLMHGAFGGSNFLKINALYAKQQDGKSQKSLYELIWKPLETQLKEANTVYCAPSGLLHRINLAAVPTPEGSVFGDQKRLVLHGSTRQLIAPYFRPQNAGNDAYLAGGIRYDADSTVIAFANHGNSSRGFELSDAPEFHPDSTNANRGGILDYLPATAAEVRIIGQMLTEADLLARVDTGIYATEEAFRHLGVDAPSPRIIHLATHGYFFPDPKDNGQKAGIVIGRDPVFKMSDHPMMRSGLIMAGARQAWLTGHHPAGKEDGILTAYEISQMNLSNTELVVLSACETGLGDIIGNEGVYGLQRAFKIAGVKYLMMSLWKVDDRNTQEFMTGFYHHWLTEKQTIPQAFRSMQQEMRAKHPSAYDWAGFVLIE